MSVNEKYLELKLFGLKVEQRDKLVSLAFDKYGCAGVEEFSLDEPAVDEMLGERSYSGGILPQEIYSEVQGQMDLADGGLTFYFYGADSDENVRLFSDFLSKHYAHTRYTLDEKESEDWNDSWREGFNLIEVTSDMAIIPSWEPEKLDHYSKGVLLYPGQGFGTGEHETTFLCLQLFDQFRSVISDKGEKSCLDYGCGSGILGLAYRRFFPQTRLTLYDIDESALENTQQNIQHNLELIGDGEISVTKDQPSQGSYGLIFANILLETLKECANNIFERLESDGYLIVSGLLTDQVEELSNFYRPLGLREIKIAEKGHWAAILFQKVSE